MASVLRVGAVVALAAVGWWLLAPTSLGGKTTYITTRGMSMHPAFADGDLVLVRSAGPYDIGDTVAYRSEQLDSVLLHRIVGVAGDRYVTRGDNNAWNDPEHPARSDLIGRARLRIPGGGAALRVVTHPSALAVGAVLLVASSGAGVRSRGRRGSSMGTTPGTTTHLPPRLRLPVRRATLVTVGGGLAAVALAAGVLAGIAWTRPTDQMVTAEDAVTTAFTFGYRAEVPASAAYDGTVVRHPDPVFRTLADSVEVSYGYDGPPATIVIDAELETGSGWRSVVPLAEPLDVERGARGAVHLDLPAIQERADTAAAVIGLPAGPIEVTVVPRVTSEGGAHFEPRLPFLLDEHALRLRDVEALAAEETLTVFRPRRAAATLSVLGLDMPVATVRAASAAVVIVALVALAGVAVATTRGRWVEDPERIRRRYGRLVLPVLPMALPPGRPVVDVPELESLVLLAERYGLLVLHWRRSGVDTFVVQDEQTTYRYRRGDQRSIGAVDEAGENSVLAN